MCQHFPFVFPETKFVATNSILKQIFHIASEVWEVVKAALRRDWQHCVIECYDVIHSTETLLRIIAKKYNINLQAAAMSTMIKNHRRGYYHDGSRTP